MCADVLAIVHGGVLVCYVYNMRYMGGNWWELMDGRLAVYIKT